MKTLTLRMKSVASVLRRVCRLQKVLSRCQTFLLASERAIHSGRHKRIVLGVLVTNRGGNGCDQRNWPTRGDGGSRQPIYRSSEAGRRLVTDRNLDRGQSPQSRTDDHNHLAARRDGECGRTAGPTGRSNSTTAGKRWWTLIGDGCNINPQPITGLQAAKRFTAAHERKWIHERTDKTRIRAG